MALAVGARIGAFEIVGALGAGGMGEVYRARDTRLQRDVALKMLPDLFASDPERLARFNREAQILASLNHPHIAAIYGFEVGTIGPATVHALVLELVEGQTLADLIAGGSKDAPRPAGQGRSSDAPGSGIPLDDALAIARQIAEALQAAHEAGVVHRDLKPANIKITPDGVVKVLDFGLAKLVEAASTSPGTDVGGMGLSPGADPNTMSPTIASPFDAARTRAGVILGTAAYMSPEQAKGREADKRSDIWAFGCVLYEMLTGRRPFEGEDLTEVLGAVVRLDPDWTSMPESVPPPVRTLVQQCLLKDRRRRVADVSTALFVLDPAVGLATSSATSAQPGAAQSAGSVRHNPAFGLAVGATVGVIVTAVAASVLWIGSRPAPPRLTRMTIAPPGLSALSVDGTDRDLAITPDGLRIVYLGGSGTQIYTRRLDELEPKLLLTVTGGVRGVFVSPDGQWVGYVENNITFKRVAMSGGAPATVQSTGGGSRGATWALDGTVIFATNNTANGLERVSENGGTPTLLTRPDRARGEADHFWPELLPGGRSVLFTIVAASGRLEAAQVAVLDLATLTWKSLIRGGHHAHYAPSGHLVYAAGDMLRAVAFDLARLEVRGTSVVVAPQLVTTAVGGADFGVGADGTLVYVAGSGSAGRTMVWVDRQGRETPLAAPMRPYANPRVSPDGEWLVVYSADQEQDLWVWNLRRSTLTRLTTEPGVDLSPVWTPDSRHIIFSSQRTGNALNIYRMAADGTSAPERLSESVDNQFVSDLVGGGTAVVFDALTRAGVRDLGLLRLAPGRDEERNVGGSRAGGAAVGKPPAGETLLQTRFEDRSGTVSPDGRWLAYETDSSGQFEIYVRPFPSVNDGQWPVSTGGGRHPVWAPNGRELFYLSLDSAVMGVTVAARDAKWDAGTPTKLVEGRRYATVNNIMRNYDVSPDGQRFLMLRQGAPGQQGPSAEIVVVQNWLRELSRLVPTN